MLQNDPANAVNKEWNVLVVSPVSQCRECLQGAFRGLPINIFMVTTSGQAQELLASLSFSIVMCEESIPDGSYRDLLGIVHAKYKQTKFVVLLSSIKWEQYQEAKQRGASEVIHCPLRPSDIDDFVLRTIRSHMTDPANAKTPLRQTTRSR